MKTRTDFVSNSSSCSFIIYLQSQKDIEEFKKIYPKFLKNSLSTVAFYGHTIRCDVNPSDLDDILFPGQFIRCDIGEDNEFCDWESLESAWDEYTDIVQSNTYKFKLYQDPDAHRTIGNEFPDKLKKLYYSARLD